MPYLEDPREAHFLVISGGPEVEGTGHIRGAAIILAPCVAGKAALDYAFAGPHSCPIDTTACDNNFAEIWKEDGNMRNMSTSAGFRTCNLKAP
jgi:hypothetical protein